MTRGRALHFQIGTMRKRSFLVVLSVAFVAQVFAQNEEDALRISTLQPGGTARSSGMGNAFGALGADPASIGINPAGFGLYRTSGLSITPAIEVNDAMSTYYGVKSGDSRTRFYFSNVALILNNPSKSGSDWRSGTFGVVYDRQQSHYWRDQAVGENVPSSILQGFANEAEGTSYTTIVEDRPFTAGLAWDAYGLDTVPGSTSSYLSYIPVGTDTRQSHVVDSRGASSTTSFFYSGNYLDRLYVGMALGIVGHRFKRTTTHTETTLDETLDLQDVTYKEDLVTSGNGFDMKVGALLRVNDRFRAGAAFHSPQWMQLSDAYATSLKTTFRTPDSNGDFSYSSNSPDGTFAYRLVTPWRAVASAAYIAGEHGLVSVDYEYADMRRMRFRQSNQLEDLYDFAVENEQIKTAFRAVHSLRVGTEWRSGPWYFRAGWGFVPDAYKKSDPRHGEALKTYAGGIGYRGEHIAVDLGMNIALRDSRYFLYAPDIVEATRSHRSNYRSLVTISFRP